MNTIANPTSNDGQASKTTHDHYYRVSQQLISRFERKFSCSVFDEPVRFEKFILDVLQNVTPNTRRVYVAALKAYEPIQVLNLEKIASAEHWPTKKQIVERHGNRTANKRSKRLPDEKMQAIGNEINRHTRRIRSLRWQTMHSLLIAGKAFGVMPSEWRKARIQDDIPAKEKEMGFIAKLEIPNSKPNPKLSPNRTIWIRQNRDSALSMAQWLIERLSAMDDALFIKEIRKMRSMLSKLQKQNPSIKVCGKYIMFCSARHQFEKDATAHGFSDIEIAAMLGRSWLTRQQYFGKRRRRKNGARGQEAFGVAPDPQQVADLEKHASTFWGDKNRQGRSSKLTEELAKTLPSWFVAALERRLI